ncbi:hypothetical protein QJQ45_003923 [Haematococcus lacustris]|nr:hypothetical protein QJQ45_003923 [Haematococcus lacustris]
MGRRSKRIKNASAVMAARVAAGIAPWTRMAGFIANRLKAGSMDHISFVRSHDIHMCPVHALGVYYYHRFTMGHGPLYLDTPLSFTQVPLISGQKSLQSMQYDGMRDMMKQLFVEHGLEPAAITHAFRKGGAMDLALSGVDAGQIKNHCHWGRRDVSEAHYLNAESRFEVLLAVGGWDHYPQNWKTTFYHPRWHPTPPHPTPPTPHCPTPHCPPPPHPTPPHPTPPHPTPPHPTPPHPTPPHPHPTPPHPTPPHPTPPHPTPPHPTPPHATPPPHPTPPHPTLPHPIPPHPIPHCPTSPHTAPPCPRNEITLGPFLDVAAVHIFSFLPAMKEASESDTIAKKFQAIFKALLAAFLEFTVVLCQDCIWLQLTAPDVYSQDHLCQHMQRCHGYQEVAEKAAQQLANGELLRRRPRGVMEILNDMYNLQLAGPAMTAALTASAARAAAVHHNTAPGQLGPLPAAAGAAAGQHSPAPGQWGSGSAASSTSRSSSWAAQPCPWPVGPRACSSSRSSSSWAAQPCPWPVGPRACSSSSRSSSWAAQPCPWPVGPPACIISRSSSWAAQPCPWPVGLRRLQQQQEQQLLGSTALPLACGTPGLQQQQQEQQLGSTALPLASGAPGLHQQQHQQEQQLGSTALPLASGAPGLQQQQEEQQLGSTALPLACGAPGLHQQQEQQLGSTALPLASGAPGLQQQEHQQEQQLLGSTALPLASGAPAEQLQQQAPVTEAMKLYRKGRYGQPPLCELEKDPSWRKGRKDLARRVCEIKKLIRLSDWYLETQCSVAKSKQEALDQLCHATRGIGAWSSQLKWLEALQGQLQPPTSPTPLAAAGRLTGLLQAPTSPTPLAAAGRLTGLLQPHYSPTPLAAAGRLTGQLQPPTSPTPLAAAGRLTGLQQPPYSPTPLAAAGSGAGQLQPPTSPTPLAAAGRLTGLLQAPTSPTPLAAAGRLTGLLQPHYSPTPLAAAGRLTGQLQPPTSPTPLAAAGRLTGLQQPPYSPTPLAAAGRLQQPPYSPTPLAAAGSGAGQLQPPTSPTPLAAAGSGAGLLQPHTSPTPLAAAGRLTGLLQPPYSPTPLAAAGPPTYPTSLAAAGSGAGLLQPPTSPTPLAAAGSGAGQLQPHTSPTPLAAAGNGAGLQLGLGCPMPCTVEHAVSAFLSHSAKNLKKTTGLMTGCNVFVCLAGAVGEDENERDCVASARRVFQLSLTASSLALDLQRLELACAFLLTDRLWAVAMADLAQLAVGLHANTAQRRLLTTPSALSSPRPASLSPTAPGPTAMGGHQGPGWVEKLEPFWQLFVTYVVEATAGTEHNLVWWMAAVKAGNAYLPDLVTPLQRAQPMHAKMLVGAAAQYVQEVRQQGEGGWEVLLAMAGRMRKRFRSRLCPA